MSQREPLGLSHHKPSNAKKIAYFGRWYDGLKVNHEPHWAESIFIWYPKKFSARYETSTFIIVHTEVRQVTTSHFLRSILILSSNQCLGLNCTKQRPKQGKILRRCVLTRTGRWKLPKVASVQKQSLLMLLSDTWFQTTAKVWMRSSLFCGVTQCGYLVMYRRLGTNHRVLLSRNVGK
jgi:hypothetical protein